MKAQVCTFKRTEKSKPKKGIAILKFEFGIYDVDYIISASDKKIIKSVWSYTLQQGIGCYIDTELESHGSYIHMV